MQQASKNTRPVVDPTLLWRTLRPLSLRQLTALVRNRWRAKLPAALAVNEAPLPGLFDLRSAGEPSATYAPVPPQPAERMTAGEFSFQRETRALGNPINWTPDGAPLLWQYNLHYFDWIWSLDAEREDHWAFLRGALVDWMQRLSPPAAKVAWAPYPTSLRTINWTLGLFQQARKRLELDAELTALLRASMWRQMSWLAGRLERHLRANHLLENAAALAIVGGQFSGRDAERWRRLGDQLLLEELDEQLLSDGCHYERSPMYHTRVLWLLEATLGARPDLADPPHDLRGRAGRARDTLTCLRHPDGEIALLNDAATGVYSLPPSAESSTGTGCWELPAAGYFGARTAQGEYVIVDAGPIGPDYQPGHAHADLLSFEWSLAGKRIVSDTGVYNYEVGPRRAYDRSTAAHNTVEIDGGNSIEVWAAFRVGRRVRPEVLAWTPAAASFELSARHAGFPGWTHRRDVRWQPGQLTIADHIAGRRAGRAVGRLHLAPGAQVRLNGDDAAVVELDGLQIAVGVDGPGQLTIERGWYSPEFGVRSERPVLAYAVGPTRSCQWSTQLNRIS